MASDQEGTDEECLSEDQILSFFAGTLPEDDLAVLEEHIGQCQICFQLVVAASPMRSRDQASAQDGPGARPSSGEVIAGRYRVGEVLGVGGSGYVVRALDQLVGVEVALKMLRPALADDERWLRRTERELLIARQLQHDNVCRVFDLHLLGGHRFLTMELACGSLRAELTAGYRNRPLANRLDDALAIARGLAAIHVRGIVHRDVKPENVLRLHDGRLVVSDFGLAASPGQRAGGTSIVGTPGYMAPEILAGARATPASDVWSFGLVMYEMLGIEAETLGLREGSRALPADAPILARALARLCDQCLKPDPAARPRDSGVIQRRIERLLQPGRHRPGRWLLGALALALPALVVFALGSFFPHGGAGGLAQRSERQPPGGQVGDDWGGSQLDAEGPIRITLNVFDEGGLPEGATRLRRSLGESLGRVPSLRVVGSDQDTEVDGQVRAWIKRQSGADQAGRPFVLRLEVEGRIAKFMRQLSLPLTEEMLRAGVLPADSRLKNLAARFGRFARRIKESRASTSNPRAFEALRAYQEAIEERPWRRVGGVPLPAMDSLVRASQEDPRYLPAFRELALAGMYVIRETGNYGEPDALEGLAPYRALAAADPQRYAVLCLYELTRFQLLPNASQSQKEDAVHACSRALLADPDTPSARIAMAEILASACEPNAALALLVDGAYRDRLDDGLTFTFAAQTALNWKHLPSLGALKRVWDNQVVVEEPPDDLSIGLGPAPPLGITAAAVNLALGDVESARRALPPSAVTLDSLDNQELVDAALDRLHGDHDPELRGSPVSRRWPHDMLGPARGDQLLQRLTWFAPSEVHGGHLIATQAGGCRQAFDRAMLAGAVHDRKSRDRLLAGCAGDDVWIRTCKARLRTVDGGR